MHKESPIRVLLVDASTISLALIKRLLQPYSDIQVVGTARNGQEGLRCVAELDPHVICTDLFMPVMDGLAFTRAVMECAPRPILVISASVQEDQPFTVFDLLAAGALDLFLKPDQWSGAEVEAVAKKLAGRIRVLAGLLPGEPSSLACETLVPHQALSVVNMVVVGGGLGALSALRELLVGLGADFPVPILAVLHVDGVFHRPLIHWLRGETSMLVQEASHGEVPMAGTVYFPQPGHHLILDGQGCLIISQAPAIEGHRPSITVTMESVVDCFGEAVIGVLLSGMGQDGLRGLAAIAQTHGVTLAQDEVSSVAFELPRQAIEMGDVKHVLSCVSMATALLNLTGQSEIDGHLHAPTPDPVESGQPTTLLIVEDSAIQAFKLRRFLQESGFVVLVAKDGQKGLEMARLHRPGLVISDVSMPRMNGFQLCRAIKSDARLADIPVMLLTALTNPEEILEGLAAGANNYLVKPWEETHLRAMIDHSLAQVIANERVEQGIEITFDAKTYTISSSRRQILDLLMTTYQKAVRQNKELMDSQLEMKLLNMRLVEMVAKETQLNQQLQSEMHERRQIESEQLRTLRELEEANRELDDFAYIIAHDLKTPLRGIGSLTNWLVDEYAENLAEAGQDLVHLLASRADRINRLIEALLQYTRVSRLNEELTQVDLSKVVNQVIKEMVVPDEVEICLESPLPVICFQESRAVEIFHHLIDNAVRHMGCAVGGVWIGCAEEEGPWWRFWVRDNGVGIEERYFSKIFEIFQTLQPRDEVETAGMGLALVRKIVEKYGGRIWVQSEVAQGSTFFFTLPKQLTPLLKVRGRKQVRTATPQEE